MSRLNTMYPDDEFLKNISDIMGKLDNKNEREIKQEIEQIGYKEFYRYYKEKDVYIKQLQQENKILKENAENNDKVVDKVNWENQLLKKQNQQLKEQLEESEKARKEAIDELIKGITFCENDSQGVYNKCNIAINREKELLKILDIDKGE